MKIYESTERRLVLVEWPGLVTYMFAHLFGLFFEGVAAHPRRKHLTFDGQKRQLLIERWSLNGKLADEVITFAEIMSVDEDEWADGMPQSFPGGGLWRIAITLRDGRRLIPFLHTSKQDSVASAVAARKLIGLGAAT